MTPERLSEIRARWEATGPDAWHVGRCADGMHGPLCPTRFSTAGQCHNLFTDSDRGVTNPCAGLDLADATFAAHAHQDVPALLAEVERLRTELREALLVAHDEFCGNYALDDCPSCGPRLRA